MAGRAAVPLAVAVVARRGPEERAEETHIEYGWVVCGLVGFEASLLVVLVCAVEWKGCCFLVCCCVGAVLLGKRMYSLGWNQYL